jgi:hypothetical protein
MKLYVIDRQSGNKKYLSAFAHSRNALQKSTNSDSIIVDGVTYHISEINAEPEDDTTAVGSLIGGVIGMIGGGPGVVIGGLIGAALGRSQFEKEKKEAQIFNGSEP